MTAAVTPGNHDGVHLGHRALVGAAKTVAERLELRTVALFFAPHPAAVLSPEHAPETLTTFARREELLLGAGADDVVQQEFDRAFASLTPEQFVDRSLGERVGARAVVVGADFGFGRDRAGNVDTLRTLAAERGMEVHVVDAVTVDGERVSSTRVRRLLADGDVAGAARLLGRLHDVDGTVVEGDRRGRTIGFPTANLDCDPIMLPADGVYAIAARRLDVPEAPRWFGVANLGVRPTFAAGRSVEAHLFDFDQDIYGSRLRVAFAERIRKEQKFDGVEALVAQIETDARSAREAVAEIPEEMLRWL